MINFASEIPLASALCSGALAAGSLLRGKRRLADFAFSAGMTALAAEGAFVWMTVRGPTTDAELVSWQRWSLFASAFLPFTWLLFSLSYARGNAREFLVKW